MDARQQHEELRAKWAAIDKKRRSKQLSSEHVAAFDEGFAVAHQRRQDIIAEYLASAVSEGL